MKTSNMLSKRKIMLLAFGLGLTLFTLIWLFGGSRTNAQSGGVDNPPPQELQNVGTASAVGTSFTYQGSLTDGVNPANGTYDFKFELYDAASGGTKIPTTNFGNDKTVTDGLFSHEMSFGDVFDGTALWLQISVRPGASTGTYTTLTPRQPLTATPYALYALDGWGGWWTGTGTGLTLTGGNTGLIGKGSTYGLYGENESTSGHGVFGFASNTAGGTTYGVGGISLSTAGKGVYGEAPATSGTTYGLYGTSNSSAGTGVYGFASRPNGFTYGVQGVTASTTGRGVYGSATATSGDNIGVQGQTASTTGWGVIGSATATSGDNIGVQGQTASTTGKGVVGYTTATSGVNYAVFGQTSSAAGYAGYFNGNVTVVGTLAKSAGSFQIDHPLDPENQYLYHSFVESPDMKNIYDGVVVLDENGMASIQMADWFDALNQEFRYQLTPIGAAMPGLYIAQEMTDNGFQIAGGEAGMKVSWQVTGIRHDPYAEANRIQVEVEKSAEERGTYLYPELYGQPEEMGLMYQHNLPTDGQ